MTIEFRILGPLEVLVGGRVVPLRGTTQRTLLAALLLHANQVVSSERLVEALWDDPPKTALKIVQNAVWQLRQLLLPQAPDDERLLVTHAGGYMLHVELEAIDAVRFERHVRDAAQSLEAGAPDSAAATLRDGLALWRGPALAEVAQEPFARAEAARLEELRLRALEDLVEADLALGRHADLVGEIEALIAERPHRERLRRQLMIALYRSGRQAEALEVYRETRRFLIDELGIEPSPAMQRLERAILVQAPSLELPVRQPGVRTAAPSVEALPPTRETRRTVSIVFADLDAKGPRLDPEALRIPMSHVIASVSAAIERHGGTVDTLPSGDVLGVFGVVAVREDDALRAARAALDVRESVALATEEVERQWGVRIVPRVGVGTGEVVADAAADNAVVAGDVVKIATRLAQQAEPGDVVVSDETRGLIRTAARVEAVDGTEPPAWRLLEIRAGAPAIPRRADTPMVGREQELKQLRAALDRVVDERTSYLFTILGVAGIGKSRLASEFLSTVAAETTALTGRCLSYGEGALWPLAEIVRQAAGDGTREAIARLLGDRDDADAIAERVAAAIGYVDAPGAAEEMFWAVPKLFESLSRAHPLILVFEDVHWAEPALLDLIEHIADWTRDAPILLVCLARPELVEMRPSWAGGKLNATSVLLEPLSEHEIDALMAHLLRTSRLPDELRTRIARAAEGNPLYLEEMVAMVEDGLVGDDIAVPPTIHALLAARLDLLEADERTVLERASVVGREFWSGAVADLSPEHERPGIDATLQMLVRRELVRPWPSFFPGDAFRFRHALIRDVAYDAVPKRERSRLHERFAGWLAQVAGERAREFDEMRGYHLEQAYRSLAEVAPEAARRRELAGDGARSLAAAGRRAYARGDMPAAVSLLSRANALLEAEGLDRLDLLVDLGEALRDTGEFERAEALLSEAIENATPEDRVLESHALIARLRVQVQVDPEITPETLIGGAQRAIRVFAEEKDDRGLAKAWELLAWAPWFRSQAAAAEEALRRAIRYSRRAGDARTEAQALNLLLGAAFFGPMHVAEAIRLCEEVLARPAEQQRVRASAMRALAGLRAMEGHFDEARDAITRHKRILDELGLTVTAAWSTETYGTVEMLAGDPAAAEKELRAGFEVLERVGETGVATLAALLAQALFEQGSYEEALRFTEISEEGAAREASSSRMQREAVRARVLARVGELDEAERLARDAVSVAERTDFLVLHANALLALADVLQAAGLSSDAASSAADALGLYEQKGNVVSARSTRALLAEWRATTSTI